MSPAQRPIRSVVAIVVSWNGGEVLETAVRSLREQRVPGRDYRVLVVDNGSGDDSVARARAAGAEVLELGENLGYGAAANRGMAHAGADASVIANQDAVYRPGFVAALADALDGDGRAGAVTAQVRLSGRFERVDEQDQAPGDFIAHDGRHWRRLPADAPAGAGEELLNSTGNVVDRSGNGMDRGWLEPVGARFPLAVFGFHGGACALRAEALAELQTPGFDERYFMYYEDTDLSWRLRRAGWTVRFEPAAVSIHEHSASSGTASPRFVEWNTRNRLWCARRNAPRGMRRRAAARTRLAALKARLVLADPRSGDVEKELAAARIRGAAAGFARQRPAPAPVQLAPVQPSPGHASRGPSTGQPSSSAGGGSARGPVLLDFTSLPPQLGGVGRYLEGLAVGLEQCGERPSLVVRPEHAVRFQELAPHARIVLAPSWIARRGMRFLWEQTGLPRLVRATGAAALHSPHYTFPLGRRSWRRIVTVHDATFFTDPGAHSRLKRVFFRWWIRRGVRADVHLVAPSEATATEIGQHAGEPRRPITVAYHGVDREVFHEPDAGEVESFRAEHSLDDSAWISFLGTIEPRKRVGELIRAHRSLGPEAPLLLVSGQRGWDEDAARELDDERANPRSRVRELGYLPYAQLRVLLGGAEVFCYPSIAEGFGLPVLEAMASGVTVLTTNRTALPEVGGDAVVYAEPDAGELALALTALLEDAPARAEFRRAGLARAAEFTWRRCAVAHLVAYGLPAPR